MNSKYAHMTTTISMVHTVRKLNATPLKMVSETLVCKRDGIHTELCVYKIHGLFNDSA
jgi:hypothetical protein